MNNHTSDIAGSGRQEKHRPKSVRWVDWWGRPGDTILMAKKTLRDLKVAATMRHKPGEIKMTQIKVDY